MASLSSSPLLTETGGKEELCVRINRADIFGMILASFHALMKDSEQMYRVKIAKVSDLCKKSLVALLVDRYSNNSVYLNFTNAIIMRHEVGGHVVPESRPFYKARGESCVDLSETSDITRRQDTIKTRLMQTLPYKESEIVSLPFRTIRHVLTAHFFAFPNANYVSSFQLPYTHIFFNYSAQSANVEGMNSKIYEQSSILQNKTEISHLFKFSL